MFIVASIGVNSLSEDKVRKIILSGADILRYNFAYRPIEESVNNILIGKEVVDSLHSSVKIMLDLPVRKFRLGDFDIKVFAVQEGEELFFRSAPYSPDCNEFVPIQIPKLGTITRPNQTITLGDGEIAIQVLEILDQNSIKVKILNNGVINFKKTINVNTVPEENYLLEQYGQIIRRTEFLKPDYLAFSYINQAFTEEMKRIFQNFEDKPDLIAKIGHGIATTQIENLCQDNLVSMIIIDRGEIGVNMPYQQVGILQKEICYIAKQYKKRVIVSTQILESTINNYIPHRAEVLDLTNMIYDGVDGIMLCHETAFGSRPAYPLSVAKKIIQEVEQNKSNHLRYLEKKLPKKEQNEYYDSKD